MEGPVDLSIGLGVKFAVYEIEGDRKAQYDRDNQVPRAKLFGSRSMRFGAWQFTGLVPANIPAFLRNSSTFP